MGFDIFDITAIAAPFTLDNESPDGRAAFRLLEDGSRRLLEDGGYRLLEESGNVADGPVCVHPTSAKAYLVASSDVAVYLVTSTDELITGVGPTDIGC